MQRGAPQQPALLQLKEEAYAGGSNSGWPRSLKDEGLWKGLFQPFGGHKTGCGSQTELSWIQNTHTLPTNNPFRTQIGSFAECFLIQTVFAMTPNALLGTLHCKSHRSCQHSYPRVGRDDGSCNSTHGEGGGQAWSSQRRVPTEEEEEGRLEVQQGLTQMFRLPNVGARFLPTGSPSPLPSAPGDGRGKCFRVWKFGGELTRSPGASRGTGRSPSWDPQSHRDGPTKAVPK